MAFDETMRAAWVLSVALSCATPVGAHMVVVPDTSRAGGAERYTLVVPTEGKSATVAVELHIPLGMDVVAFESKPGWSGASDAFPIGAATLRWSNGRIPPGQMMSFEFLAVNPEGAHTVTWNASQRYEDGSTDRWGEGAPAEHEASTTTLVAASTETTVSDREATAHEHGREPVPPPDEHAVTRPEAGGSAGAVPPRPAPAAAATFWIALAALAASLTALALAIGAWRRAPR